MLVEINLPDELHRQAERIAQKEGISLDQFIADAIEIYLGDDYEEPATPKPQNTGF
jgi:metal-responsive CopG/Arc/MetJ family transcriptional regulator